ncbi:hypothetical protein ACSBR1_033432 [Camellia fascicularis]
MDFVDFLFGLFEFPLGSFLALLTKHNDTTATFGSLSRLYQRIEVSQSQIFGISPTTAIVTSNVNVVEGYVKGGVTYMVMDDLMVKPMSSISSIVLLNNLEIKEISCLQEKTLKVDMDKV